MFDEQGERKTINEQQWRKKRRLMNREGEQLMNREKGKKIIEEGERKDD